MRYCGHFLIKAEGGAKNYERDHPLPLAWRPFTVFSCSEKIYILLASERSERDTLCRSSMENAICIYLYLITSILRNIASQLQCISASAAGTSAIPVTDEQYSP